MLNQGKWRLEEYQQIRRTIYARKAMIEDGARAAPRYWNDRLLEVDADLRARWDYERRCWAVDTWVTEWRCWVPLLWVVNEQGDPAPFTEQLLIDLKAGDMRRWDNPEEYLRFKREKAGKRRKENLRLHNERVGEAVEKMSEKRIREFLAVTHALKTGERIIAHGPMLRFLELVDKRTRALRAQQFERRLQPQAAPLMEDHV